MSTENIYGGWDEIKDCGKIDHELSLQALWSRLAACKGKPNFGLTQRKNEIIELWRLYRAQQPRIVLEIGTAQGGTLASWCQLGDRSATIIAIDRCLDDCRPRPGDPVSPMIYDGQLRMTSQGGGIHSLRVGRQRMIGINGWSHDPAVMAALLSALDGRKIDFLFHDASHKCEMFKADFELYWPLVADGGIFASHDIMPSDHPDCNKSVAWEEIKSQLDYSACYEYKSRKSENSMGIGVFIK